MTMQTETEDPRRRAIGGRWASAPRLVLLAATAAAFTLLGLAPSSATAHRVRDRARDTVDHGGRPARDYDIRAAKSDRHGRHKLKHVVRVRGHALIGDAAVPGSGVSVEIDARKGSPGDCGGLTRDPRHRAEYVVSAELGGVVDCRHPLATARRMRVKGRAHALVFIFRKNLIGNPKHYRWFASTGHSVFEDDFSKAVDFAPDAHGSGAPRYVRQRVGRGHHRHHHRRQCKTGGRR